MIFDPAHDVVNTLYLKLQRERIAVGTLNVRTLYAQEAVEGDRRRRMENTSWNNDINEWTGCDVSTYALY